MPDKVLGSITIQTLDENGGSLDTYKYYKGGSLKYKTEGWYFGTDRITADNDVTFDVGDGLWVAGLEGVTFTTSGEVVQQNIDCELIEGSRMLCNPYPCDIKLTQISLHNLPDKVLGSITIQTLDENGGSLDTYKYYKGGSLKYKTEGWYFGTDRITEENDVTFASGDGLWVAGLANVILRFNKPF